MFGGFTNPRTQPTAPSHNVPFNLAGKRIGGTRIRRHIPNEKKWGRHERVLGFGGASGFLGRQARRRTESKRRVSRTREGRVPMPHLRALGRSSQVYVSKLKGPHGQNIDTLSVQKIHLECVLGICQRAACFNVCHFFLVCVAHVHPYPTPPSPPFVCNFHFKCTVHIYNLQTHVRPYTNNRIS